MIVLTSSKAPIDGQSALAAGCDGYLCKRVKIADMPAMVAELKMAIRGEVFMVTQHLRHAFLREDISAKEARLMDLLNAGKSWSEIASELSYKTSKAAANIGDRIFDKLLAIQGQVSDGSHGIKKRDRALSIWRQRQKVNLPQTISKPAESLVSSVPSNLAVNQKIS